MSVTSTPPALPNILAALNPANPPPTISTRVMIKASQQWYSSPATNCPIRGGCLMKPKEVVEFARDRGVKIVDLRFIDLPGVWQHFSTSVSELSEEIFEDGIGFDGSSIRGFQSIHKSDMLLFPDAGATFMDPFTEVPTLVMICNVRDPVTGQAYTRDPRFIAQKAEKYMDSTGIADTVYIGPEPEFFVFDDVRFAHGTNYGYYYLDSNEAAWNSGRDERPNLGYKIVVT